MNGKEDRMITGIKEAKAKRETEMQVEREIVREREGESEAYGRSEAVSHCVKSKKLFFKIHVCWETCDVREACFPEASLQIVHSEN